MEHVFIEERSSHVTYSQEDKNFLSQLSASDSETVNITCTRPKITFHCGYCDYAGSLRHQVRLHCFHAHFGQDVLIIEPHASTGGEPGILSPESSSDEIPRFAKGVGSRYRSSEAS